MREPLETFTEYFVRNYPGPDTIIFDPKWHAPKIFNAAKVALNSDDLIEERDRLREALVESRNVHAELAEFLLGDGGSAVKRDVLQGMFADLQRARLAADAALERKP